MRKTIWFIFFTLILIPGVYSETLPQLSTKTKSVSLFKNGLGYFVRQGTVPQTDGWAQVDPLPVPVHGTFLLTTTQGLIEATAGTATLEKEVEAVSMTEVLRSNIGKSMELTIDKKPIKGKLISIPNDRLAEDQYSPYQTEFPVEVFANLIVFETDEGIQVFPLNVVQRIRFNKSKINLTYSKKTKGTSLKLHFQGAKAGDPLNVSYLQHGITWAPSYIIDIADETQATVVLTAQIINEIEDLEDVTVNFITGYPNLKFSNIVSPISLKTDLAGFMSSISGQGSNFSPYNRRGEVLAQQSVLLNYMPDNEAYMGNVNTQPDGSYQEDLFFYEKEHINLKRGECGHYTLMEAQIPYRHIYEWDVEDTVNGAYYNAQNSRSQNEIVWHSLELENTSKIPWTTGAATTLKGNKILGQDISHYTPVGGKSLVKITRSTDIKAIRNEYEISRNENSHKKDGYYYDLVKIKGELSVANYKSKDVNLSITKHITGNVLKSSDKGEVKVAAEGLKAVNSNSVIKWEIDLKSGKEHTITYEYEVYISR